MGERTYDTRTLAIVVVPFVLIGKHDLRAGTHVSAKLIVGLNHSPRLIDALYLPPSYQALDARACSDC